MQYKAEENLQALRFVWIQGLEEYTTKKKDRLILKLRICKKKKTSQKETNFGTWRMCQKQQSEVNEGI